MFGTPVKVGLKKSCFPNDYVEHLRTEEELQDLIETVNNTSENNDSETEFTESDMEINDQLKNASSFEVDFVTQKEDEAASHFIQIEILNR